MLLLDTPDVLHPFSVQERNTQGVVALAAQELCKQPLKEKDGSLLSMGPPPAMESQLLPGKMLVDIFICQRRSTLGHQQLSLCLAKHRNISRIPLKNAC